MHKEIQSRLQSMGSVEQALHLMRFFKTAPGEYGEGDRFLGLKVPQTRAVVAEYKKRVTLADIAPLLESEWHEVRLAGFLLLIEIYKREKSKAVVDFYLSMLHRGNNWDLVDLVAPKILGDWLWRHPEERSVLDELASMDGHLWHQRVAMVSTWTLITKGEYDDTIRIAERLQHHSHDLIHKAVGWMLREVGKRGGLPLLLAFLDTHAATMPRTALRYAIERLSPAARQHYMRLK